MPYQSAAQRAYLHINEPAVAARWDKKYPESAHSTDLPKHKPKSAAAQAAQLSSLLKEAKPAPTPELSHAFTGLGEWVSKNFPNLFSGYTKGQTIQKAIKSQGGGAASKVKPIAQAAELARKHKNIGMGAAGAAGGAAAMAGYGLGSMQGPAEPKPPEQMTVQAEAQLGTPYTDGILQMCLEHKLEGDQVYALLEKGAQCGGHLGDECRGLLDRMSQIK